MNVQTPMTALAADRSIGVRIDGVNLSYGTNHVLKNIDLDIRPGEFFAFLGPSGCGKTTLLRLIAGFNVAQEGRIVIGKTDVANLPPWKRDVGMVFQSYALWPHMTVRQNVAFGLEERRVPRAQIGPRVEMALDLVGLLHLAERRPSQLSGGQQQRVALARTIVVEPKILLLDEPLSNLDAKLRVQMRQELLSLQRKLGLTTIFVTHDQEEANTICDRIAVMSDGVVQQVGTPLDLYDRPANLFVANFLGTANVLPGTVRTDPGGPVFVIGDGIAVPLPANRVRQGDRLMFRPQVVSLRRESEPARPGCVGLAGSVLHREFLGASIRYVVGIVGHEVLVDVPHITGEPVIETGTRVVADLPPDKTMVMAG